MPEKTKILDEITKEIFSDIKSSPNKDEAAKISAFIKLIVNGDMPIDYLKIDANLTKNKPGIIVYILTDRRLIKIDIDTATAAIKSSNFIISKIISIDFNLAQGKTEVLVNFENGSFGLSYPFENDKITEFFQKVDQLRLAFFV